jgi:hypothetical protein
MAIERHVVAEEIMALLQKCGVRAEYTNEAEESIHVLGEDGLFLFNIDTEKEWEQLKIIVQKIAKGLGE